MSLRTRHIIKPRSRDAFDGHAGAMDSTDTHGLYVKLYAIPRNQIERFKEVTRTQGVDVEVSAAIVKPERELSTWIF